jgi:hypothetical protein
VGSSTWRIEVFGDTQDNGEIFDGCAVVVEGWLHLRLRFEVFGTVHLLLGFE